MVRLCDSNLRSELKKPRDGQVEIPDGTLPGLSVRVGGGKAATWTLIMRISGEGGVSARGLQLKGRRRRLTLGTYPELGIEAARARANLYRSKAKQGESPVEALERAATAGGLTVETLAKRFQLDYVESRQLRAGRKYRDRRPSID